MALFCPKCSPVKPYVASDIPKVDTDMGPLLILLIRLSRIKDGDLIDLKIEFLYN